jgi:hypothetical protein
MGTENLVEWSELSKPPDFAGQVLPSLATIARRLKQQGKTRPYKKQPEQPQVLSPTTYCHEEWEMDGRGQEQIPNVGIVSLIQINDVHSRAKLISYPCWMGQKRIERYPATQDYQLICRYAFVRWGLPDRMAVDRARVFFDSNPETPFPTEFHSWLLALGVQLTFGRPRQPRDQAITERSHQTWWAQVVEGQTFDHLEDLWGKLEVRRDFLNRDLPCATLEDQPPLVAFPEALQPRRCYRPEWEEEMLDLQRIYDYLGQHRWFRRSSKVGTVSLGGHNYSLGKEWYNLEVAVSFDPMEHTFIFQAPSKPERRLPIRWLTKASLMGELTPIACFSQFQLLLPFSQAEFRTLFLTRLFETLVT